MANQHRDRQIFNEIQQKWNLNKIKTMTLEEYDQLGNKNTFTYFFEYTLKDWGSVKGLAGGLTNLKFWICHCGGKKYDIKRKVLYSSDKQYAWLAECYDKDNNPIEAFKEIRNRIFEVIQASQNNDLDKIETIKLDGMCKWKIAFHYQNPDDMKMFCIFRKNTLRRIAENELSDGSLPISQIYMRLMGNKKYTLEDSINERSIPLWEKYNTNDDRYDENSQLYINKNKGDSMKTIPSLNQILYGPPGTGKTYSTIDKALEILHYYGEIDTIPEERKDKKALFDKYCKGDNRQIEFVTFHQSFSYEEFVEGIKPNTDNPENMIYEPKEGIFKKICDRALYKEYQLKNGESEIQIDTKTRVWKISIVAKSEKEELRNKVLKHCLEKDEIRIGWSDNRTLERISMLGRNDQSSIYQFEDEADIGDIVCVFENANGDIKGIGIIESEFYWDNANNDEVLKLYPRVRKVKWLSNKQINIRDLNMGTNLTQKTFYPLDRVNAIELLNRIGKLDKKDLVVDNTQKPFVLIIDEINRGNISKILGELITLIEPSKRIGASDEEKARGIGNESLEVTLPYSNDSFGVPSNLYIIGTMNTADRSIALLDTALRRRFEFVEMMPYEECLKNMWLVENDEDYENSSIDLWDTDEAEALYNILTAINHRIEFLLDREHTIGHAFFFEKAIKEDGYFVLSLNSLKKIFAKKIIPLLQEYFYDDYAKIDAVLGGNGMVVKTYKSVVSLFQNPKSRPDDLEDKTIYNIAPLDSEIWDNPQTYTNIYGGGKVEDLRDFSELDENEPK